MSTPTTIVVGDSGHAMVEPVLGAARYSDGSIILVTERDAPWAPGFAGRQVYRTRGDDTRWSLIWELPPALFAFITGQPVGTTSKVSGRRAEVVDVQVAIPSGRIDVARGVNDDSWVSW